MRKKSFYLVMMGLASVLLLSACGKPADTAQSAISEEKVIKMMESNEISSMDPGNAMDGGSFIAITQVFEGLYNLDDQDNIIPGVAKALPEISEDGLTYRISLRNNAVWSNGDLVTAQDFVYAWQRVVDPEFGSPSSFLALDVKNAAAILAGEADKETLGVKALDDETLEIQLEEPVAYFTSVLTFPTFFPQNQTFVESQSEDYGLDSDHMIYNGPYELRDWQAGDQTWTYQKNNRYWNAKQSNVDKVAIQVVKEPNVAVNLFKTGDLDRAVLSGEFARQYRGDENYTTQLDSWVHTLELNQQRSETATIFATLAARQALSLAVDRTHIVQQLLGNDSEEIYGLIPAQFVKNPESQVDFREENGALQKYDAAQAKTLWQQALADAGESEVTVTLLATDQEENKQIAEYLQYQLQETLPGLKIEIQLLPEKNLLEKKQNHDFDLLLTRQGPDFQDPTTFLNTYQSEAFQNPSGYHNPAYDELLKKARALSADPAARWQYLLEAEKLLMEDSGVIPLYQSANTALLRENIHGMIHHLFGPPNFYGKINVD